MRAFNGREAPFTVAEELFWVNEKEAALYFKCKNK